MTAQGRSYSFQDYAALDRVNHSRLCLMDESPLKYQSNPPFETESLNDGNLVHTCYFEPQVYDRTTAVWQYKPNTKAHREWKAALAESGVQPLTKSKDAWVRRMVRSLVEHPVAANMFSAGQSEISVEWTHPLGVECKSRIDYIGLDKVVDLKTTRSIHPRSFNWSIRNYHYDSQAAFYCDAVEALTGERLPFYFVAVEKQAPYDVAAYLIDEAILEVGRKKYRSWLERLIECKERDEWPGMFTEPTKAEMPNWYFEQLEDDTLYVDGVAV